MFGIREKPSKWKFDTSGTGGLGLGVIAVEGGLIRLKDPHNNFVDFHFAAFGAGWSKFKIPKFISKHIPKTISDIVANYISKIKLPKIRGKTPSGTIAPTWFFSEGVVCILDIFKGYELTRSDITGGCVFVELGAGILIGGHSGCAMLLGMNPILLGAALAAPQVYQARLITKALKTATCITLMRGDSLGILGISAAVYVGYLGQEEVANGYIQNANTWLGKLQKVLIPTPAPRQVIAQKQPAQPPVNKRPTHMHTQKKHTRKHPVPIQRKKCFPDWQELDGFPGIYWYDDGKQTHFTNRPTCS